MGLKEKIINALGGTVSNKTANSAFGNDFLKYGNRQPVLNPEWSDVRISDEDMYKGYGYAVIQKRGNKVATLAKTNLTTWAKPEIVDEFQKRNETPIHPYLKLIEDSKKFTEKQFYKNISIYLDLAGVYYLGAVRVRRKSSVPTLPDIITDVKEFVLLNPYEIRRVVNKDGEVAGYIERKKDGRYREWPKDMIIEMKELNPFDPEKSQWAMTDAAKEAVYTITKTADYTRQSLNGNIDAPGIITTDVILPDEDFANFKQRVLDHRQGEPLFGNGSGAIKWDSMQVDLDKAALMDINEINRTTLFAVSGTSKTALGIEQSGTTRDTANVQRELLMSDTIQPRLEDIIDFLNLDYKKTYPKEYEQTGYYIEVVSAVGKDYATEKAATESRQAQFELYKTIADAGYTDESAKQYATGDIELADLEEDEAKMAKLEAQAQAQPPEDENPNDDSNGGPDNGPDNEPDAPQDAPDNTEQENDLEGYENIPGTTGKIVKMEKELSENETHDHEECECCKGKGIEMYENDISIEDSKILTESFNSFIDTVREIEKETLKATENKLTINSFTESDLITEKKKNSLKEKLKNALKQYWWILVPLFGENAVNQRNNEFHEDYKFKFTNDFKVEVENNAERVADGHIKTILDDVLEASNNAYTKVVETAAGELIIKAYKANSEKFADYFDHIPDIDEALKAIRNTDILEKNRKIYEKANQMARDGFDRKTIIKAIRNEYKAISQVRATMIARNETSRAFTKSQYEADLQFLNSIGKLQNAYKQLYSRSGNPCKYCQAVIDMGPIPFTQNFLDKGGEITVNSDGKISTFKADYENIDAGVLHPNCNCGYKLIIKEDKVENDISGNLLNGGFNLASWLGSNHIYESKEMNTTVDITDGDKKIHIDLDNLPEEEVSEEIVSEEPLQDEKSLSDKIIEGTGGAFNPNEYSPKSPKVYEEVPAGFFDVKFTTDDFKEVLPEEEESKVEIYREALRNGYPIMPVVCLFEPQINKYIVESGLDRLRAYYLENIEPEIHIVTTPEDGIKYMEENKNDYILLQYQEAK